MKKLKFTLKIITIISIISVFIFAFTACIKDNNSQTTTGECFDFEPASSVKEGQKNIYLVIKVLKTQYWQDIVNGTAKAAEELGCNLYVGASELEGDWQTQQQLMKEAVDRGADAILLCPGNSTALSSIVAEIHKTTPVVLIDTILNDTESFDSCYMTDNIQAGELAAQEMIKQLTQAGVKKDENAQIAIQITSVASQTVIDRLSGFNKYWFTNAPANWKVIDEVKLNNGNVEKATQNCLDLINDYPDLKGVFGCNNSSTVGFANGLSESENHDIVLVGFDYADETAELIRLDDYNAATIVQNQSDMGYEALYKAVDILNGGSVDYKFVDTGTRVVNHENYTEYEQDKGE